MQDPPSPPCTSRSRRFATLAPVHGRSSHPLLLTPIRPRRRRFVPKPTGKRFRINDFIRAPEVRVVDEEGKPRGILPTPRALELARERGFDLVEVNPVAKPPICKLLNWGAYQYQQEKLERKHKAKQHRIEIKGIRLSLQIGKHDLELRQDQARRFFERGDKVKVELILRGRERQHSERARQMMEEFVKSLGTSAYVESPLTAQGGRLSLLAGWRGGPVPKRESAEDETPTETEDEMPVHAPGDVIAPSTDTANDSQRT